MGSGRTRSGSSSAITWSSLRRRCLSGRSSQSCSAEQGQKGGDWPGDGKYVPAIPWKTHPSPSSDLGPFGLFGLKLLWCCCLMTCRVTPEADLVLKVPVSSAIKQQDCSGHDLHCFLASPMAPFIIHLCLGVPKARTNLLSTARPGHLILWTIWCVDVAGNGKLSPHFQACKSQV